MTSISSGGDAAQATEYADLTLLELMGLLLSRWRLLLGLPIVAGTILVAVSFLVPNTYTATVTFVPEVRREGMLPSGIAGIAGQFGISLGGESSESPRFYAQVVESRELLERLLLSHYANPKTPGGDSADSVTLLSLLEVKGHNRLDSLANGVRALDDRLHVRVDNQTRVVRVSVESRYPALAAEIANRVVKYLNEFNTRTRQSQASERRKFVELRVADGEHALREAEEALRSFYERNRSWQQAPQLVFEEGRLRRQVEIWQEVYLTLRREYETARIEEVNDTPVITVLDSAIPPAKKSRPDRPFLAAGGIAIGLIASVLIALVGRYFERAQTEDSGRYRALANLASRVRGEAARVPDPRRSP